MSLLLLLIHVTYLKDVQICVVEDSITTLLSYNTHMSARTISHRIHIIFRRLRRGVLYCVRALARKVGVCVCEVVASELVCVFSRGPASAYIRRSLRIDLEWTRDDAFYIAQHIDAHFTSMDTLCRRRLE